MTEDTNRPSTHAEIFGTTATPCPSWCELPDGHGYDSGTETASFRIHIRHVDEMAVNGEPAIWIDVQAEETQALSLEGFETNVEAPSVRINADGVNLTGAQARQLANTLLGAADLWDEVAGA